MADKPEANGPIVTGQTAVKDIAERGGEVIDTTELLASIRAAARRCSRCSPPPGCCAPTRGC